MTNYHVYADQVSAQAAADDMTAKYVPIVHETDLQGNPTDQQVTQIWASPQQRNDGQWVVQEYPGYVPTPAPIATEPYDPNWFIPGLVNTTPPVLSHLTAGIGNLVKIMTPGVWAGNPDLITYQWMRDGTPINQAITPNHTVTIPDVNHTLTCQETAKNSAGSKSVLSNACTVT